MGRRTKMNKSMKRRLREEDAFDGMEQQAAQQEALKGRAARDAKHVSKALRRKNRRDAKDGLVVGKSDESSWFKIRAAAAINDVPEKDFLKESFASMIEEEWVMYGYHKSTSSAKFYVEGAAIAKTITALNKRIKSASGKVLHISSEACRVFMQLNIKEVQVLREVLQSRCSAAGVLDLKALQKDPRLLAADILLVMADGGLLKQVMLQIRDHFSHVTALDLSENLLHLSNIKTVVNILKNCSINALNLEKNCIQSLIDLVNVLSAFPLISELRLASNPCVTDIKDEQRYLRTIQSKLPALKQLDGVTVTGSSPPPFTDERVKQFLEQFYQCLDSSERAKLLDAYLPTAEFGVASEVSPGGKGAGHAVVAEGLKVLPPSQHLVDTFSLEQVTLQPAEAQYVVRGRVRMEGVGEPLLFAHSFCVVPYGAGVSCKLSVLEYKKEVPQEA